MKSNWISDIILAAAVAAAGYFIGNTHKKAAVYERHVEVKGVSERNVKANLAFWPIQVVLSGNDLQALNRTIEQQKTDVRDFLRQQGFSDEEIIIGPTNTEDLRANSYSQSPFRYVSRANITVHTSYIDKMKKALFSSSELLSRGILLVSTNTWEPVQYSYTELNAIKPEMVEEATRNAKEVAQKFAKDSGAKVGAIRSARQGVFTIENRYPTTPDVKTVRVVSTIEYLLEN